MNPFNAEPVALINAFRLVCLAGITFGLHLTMTQLTASALALEAVLTLFTRSKVMSQNTLQSLTPSTLAAAQDASVPMAGRASSQD